MLKKKKEFHAFRKHLHQGKLNLPWNIDKEGAVSFHWANWDESTEYIRNLTIESAEKKERRLKSLERHVNTFKKVPIWLKSRRGQKRVSLFELYRCYSDSRLRLTWFDRQEEILVSMHNESGPYITLSSMRWFDPNIYACFRFLKLLNRELPQRRFRMGLNFPVSLRLENCPLKSIKGRIHQIDDEGVVVFFNGLSRTELWPKDQSVFISKDGNIPILKKRDRTADIFKPAHWYDLVEDFEVSMEVFNKSYKEARADQKDSGIFLFFSFSDIHFFNTKKAHSHKKGEVKCMLNEAESYLTEILKAS